MNMNFELGQDSKLPGSPAAKPAAPKPAAPAKPAGQELDFDIGTRIAPIHLSDDPELPQPDLNLGGDSIAPASYPPNGNGGPDSKGPLRDDAVEFDVSLTESTFLGRHLTDSSPVDISSIDLDLEPPDPESLPGRTAPSGTVRSPQSSVVDAPALELVQSSTALNPDFAREQQETAVVSPGFDPSQGETAVNPDFTTAQTATLVTPDSTTASQAATTLNIEMAGQHTETVVTPPAGGARATPSAGSEEVATKLDLAKAYEEMGDAEGARELLQEILREGSAAQREAAQAMLTRIGG
jgi:pilus assembly protein FimV